jgi:hypothetical protein
LNRLDIERFWEKSWGPLNNYCYEEEGYLVYLFNNYFYFHAKTVYKKKKKIDLIKLVITQFATTYLTLICLNDYKMHLNTMFTSKQWRSNRFSRIEEGKRIQNCVLNIRFWYYITICIKTTYFLVKVLWLFDSDDKSIINFIYEAMDWEKKSLILVLWKIDTKLLIIYIFYCLFTTTSWFIIFISFLS